MKSGRSKGDIVRAASGGAGHPVAADYGRLVADISGIPATR
jgi:hypothetical protein